jgi:hypothetical protein
VQEVLIENRDVRAAPRRVSMMGAAGAAGIAAPTHHLHAMAVGGMSGGHSYGAQPYQYVTGPGVGVGVVAGGGGGGRKRGTPPAAVAAAMAAGGEWGEALPSYTTAPAPAKKSKYTSKQDAAKAGGLVRVLRMWRECVWWRSVRTCC